MLPRPKFGRVLLVAVPLILAAVLWQSARQRPRSVEAPGMVQSLALSGDGKRLAIVTADNRVFWREDGNWQALPLESLPASFGETPQLRFSRDGHTLIGADTSSIVTDARLAYSWNLETNKIKWSVDAARKEDVGTFVLSHDEGEIVRQFQENFEVLNTTNASAPRVKSHDRSMRDFPITRRLRVLIPYDDTRTVSPARAALSADDRTLITADMHGALQFWDIATGKQIDQAPPIPKPSANLDMNLGELQPSPDGRSIALCYVYGVAVWDRRQHRWMLGPQTTPTQHYVAWMPDSRSLWLGSNVSTGEEKNLTRQLNVPDLKTMRVLPEWGPLALSDNGRTLATGTSSSTPSHVRLWNIN